MVQIINKNILTVDSGIICHQVNCQRAMGAGIALAIANKWPRVCSEYRKVDPKLGLVQVVSVIQGSSVKVANLFAQNLRPIINTRRCTDYDALEKCLTKISSYAFLAKEPIYIPYMIGCGLGGGDWEIVLDMIMKITPNATICRYTP